MVPYDPATPAPKQPGIAGVVIGVILMVLGLIVGVVLIVVGVLTTVAPIDQAPTFQADGSDVTVSLDDTVETAIWIEDDDRASGECHVTGADGSNLPLSTDKANSLTLNDYTVQLTFFPPTPGDYEVGCLADANTAFTFKVAPVSVGSGVGFIVGGVIVIVLGLVGGLILVIITGVRRSRWSSRFESPAVPAMPQGYPSTGPQFYQSIPGQQPYPGSPPASAGQSPVPAAYQQPGPASYQSPAPTPYQQSGPVASSFQPSNPAAHQQPIPQQPVPNQPVHPSGPAGSPSYQPPTPPQQ